MMDAGYYVLCGSKDVKCLQDLSNLEIHTVKRAKDLFVLSTSSFYVNKMRTNNGTSIWHA